MVWWSVNFDLNINVRSWGKTKTPTLIQLVLCVGRRYKRMHLRAWRNVPLWNLWTWWHLEDPYRFLQFLRRPHSPTMKTYIGCFFVSHYVSLEFRPPWNLRNAHATVRHPHLAPATRSSLGLQCWMKRPKMQSSRWRNHLTWNRQRENANIQHCNCVFLLCNVVVLSSRLSLSLAGWVNVLFAVFFEDGIVISKEKGDRPGKQPSANHQVSNGEG